MTLPKPQVDETVGPKGRAAAVIFPNCLILTYWELWCLLAAQQKFHSDLNALRSFLFEKRVETRSFSFFRNEIAEDLIHLLNDLTTRLNGIASVNEILSELPERIKKKEAQKAIRCVIECSCNHEPSELMLRSPGRLLKEEAFRGEWAKLPVDPSPIAERLMPLFLPKPKIGYFPKGTTFALSKRIDKQVKHEASLGGLFLSPAAQRYSAYRAALTLYQEENSWDDSYGSMGEVGQEWVQSILNETPSSVGAPPEIFLKDLLMFLVWEDYGLSNSEQVAAYIKALPLDQQDLSHKILTDIHDRCAKSFRKYQADEARQIIEKIIEVKSESPASLHQTRHLQLVSTPPSN